MEEQLNNENYFTPENRKKYMSASLFKEFNKCEVYALAKLNGEIVEEQTDALLFGSYVDAYFSNELEDFKKKHPEIYNARTGELKSTLKNVDKVIKAIEEDSMMMKYLNGDHQVVVIGEIEGVPFKGKIDSFFKDKLIVDQKVIKDLDLVWIERDGYNVKVDFVEAYDYFTQGAVYQCLVEQNTGKKLPFVLAVVTKEDNPAKKLIQIDQEYLDEALEKVKEKAPRYWKIMKGELAPQGCGHCSACRKKQKVTGVESYKKIYHTDEIEY